MGHEVRILTLSKDRQSYQDGNVIYIGSIGIGKIYPDARIRLFVAQHYIRDCVEWKPDIIHSQCEFSTFYLAKKISRDCGAPIIHTYHTVYENYTHYFSPSVRVGKIIAATLSKRLLSKTQAVIAPTEKVKEMLLGYGIVRPIITIPSGLQMNRFVHSVPAEELEKIRQAMGISSDKKILVYVGRLAKEKNIEELFALLDKMREDRLILLIVGDGPYRNELELLAKKLKLNGKVIFTGMVSSMDVAKYYRLGNVFVSASQSETQGLTYIEAMACGLPVVCRKDKCLDAVVRDGYNGYLYDNLNTFYNDVHWLLLDEKLEKRMGQNAAIAVRKQYSADQFSMNVVNLYKKVIYQSE
jgi:1,2-diacylglycerol 3-alpha-glucosyltransferase